MMSPDSSSPQAQDHAGLKDPNSAGGTTEPRPIDESYKRFFSHRTMVRHLLKGFVPGRWHKQLDLSTLEPMPTNFVSDLSRQRYCDVVWRVKWKNSQEWVYIYLLIEFQARPDRFMAARLMVYEGLLLQALSKLPEYSREGALLPAIVPIVLYNGQERWKMPLRLSRLM
ncbi:MAG: Rpn family recombination-promoting nuclease/putative transposase, partial [bacterium]|nr:Rpn family recombination-promoting nuclease/putative transposase [bacterium]